MRKGKAPSITDYMAGAILANGPIWMWAIAIGYFSGTFLTLPPVLIVGLSLIIYVACGSLASYLVCQRAEEGLLFVVLKLVAAEWTFSIMMMLSTISEASPGQAFLLLICFFIGGFIGAYLSVKKRLKMLSGD